MPDHHAPRGYPPSVALFGDVGLHAAGDFGAGALALAGAVLAALVERSQSGRGRVVTHSILGGAALMSAPLSAVMKAPAMDVYASGAPFYGLYETADGRFMSVAAFEARFYSAFLSTLGLPQYLESQYEERTWPAARADIGARFKSRTLAQWVGAFAEVDGCVAPVLTLEEAAAHPQNRANGHYIADPEVRLGRVFGFGQGTTPSRRTTVPHPGEHTIQVLAEAGFDEDTIRALTEAGVVA
jgi:alpha-methylacyl-CoA racemase